MPKSKDLELRLSARGGDPMANRKRLAGIVTLKRFRLNRRLSVRIWGCRFE
jgi:hypothetical protein